MLSCDTIRPLVVASDRAVATVAAMRSCDGRKESGQLTAPFQIIFIIAVWRAKRQNPPREALGRSLGYVGGTVRVNRAG
jgi:hypothetical protein